jgi:hypothetical protein
MVFFMQGSTAYPDFAPSAAGGLSISSPASPAVGLAEAQVRASEA